MIILLNHTIETQAIYEVKKQTNTSSGLSLLEQQYSKNGIVDVYNYITNHVATNPSLYGEKVSELVNAKQYNEAVDATFSGDRTMLHMGYMFDSAYEAIFAELQSEDYKLVITLPYNTKKPANVDVFIGWAVAEQDYSAVHMEEHEGIEASRGQRICEVQNQHMIDNAFNYDIFLNKQSPKQLIDYINTL